jgi:threonine dehydrogenase-like Zn-dependent dehydrogenase
MNAIAIVPGTQTIRLVHRPEPSITAPAQVLLRVIRVGICGTDRDEALGGRAMAPPGQSDLVIGHEMFGQVQAAGAAVQRVRPGDYAVFTVRRGCAACLPCLMDRADMCLTGNYRERGIWGLDGYQAEYVMDLEPHLIAVPPELESIGVLTEPMSVAEKAIAEAVQLQTARLPDAPATPDWLFGRRCLVAGLGPIGLLAALALRLRGAEVFGLDIVDRQTVRPQWLETIGGNYVDGRTVTPDKLGQHIGPCDLIFEATGIPSLAFELLDALAVNGAYVLTGIPFGDRPIQLSGGDLMRRLVLQNQVMVGSVNAAPAHFRLAIRDLAAAHSRWGDHIAALITHRHAFTDFAGALQHHDPDEIKTVVEWGQPEERPR